MDSLPLMFGRPGLQALTGLAIGYGVLRLYRWMRRESPPLAAIFVAGLLLRAGLGLALFWTSYLDLPFLRGLHSSDGFWAVAPDAHNYVARATRAAFDGLATVGSGSASPAYVQLLALWMRVVGISPITGMFLNLVMYTLLCALLVYVWKPRGDWRHDLPCVVLFASLSFSPGLVIHGTQSLKDDMFAFLVSIGSVGALLTFRPVFEGWRSVRPAWAPVFGFAAILVAVYYAAGIRTYYAFFMLASLGAVLVLFAVRWNMDRLRRSVPLAAVILLLTGTSYVAGAGPYESYLRPLFSSEIRWRILPYLDAARISFQGTGGGTNVAAVDAEPAARRASSSETPRLETAPGAAKAQAGSTLAPSLVRLRQLAVGLTALFVPVSLLRSLSIVDFSGGRGLLFVTDIDTVFIDATILATLVLLYLRWDIARRHLPYVCFLLLLACTTIALMAYIVTNFGTVFRLRMMAVVPFWMLALSTSGGRFMSETSKPNRLRAVRVSQPAFGRRLGVPAAGKPSP